MSELISNKRGQSKVNGKMAAAVIFAVVIIIVLFSVIGDTANDVGFAADNFTSTANPNTTSGADVYPLTSFFRRKGVILLAFMAGIAITVIAAVMKK